jgi:hypothetical protein
VPLGSYVSLKIQHYKTILILFNCNKLIILLKEYLLEDLLDENGIENVEGNHQHLNHIIFVFGLKLIDII